LEKIPKITKKTKNRTLKSRISILSLVPYPQGITVFASSFMKQHKIINEKIFKINQVKNLAYTIMVSSIILRMELLTLVCTQEKTEMSSPEVLFNSWFRSIVFRLGSEAL